MKNELFVYWNTYTANNEIRVESYNQNECNGEVST